METSTSERRSDEPNPLEWIEVVRQNVANLRFGSVQITVHDGRVTQIESIEKIRFTPPRSESRSGTA
jgi:hypothetical protein